MTPPLQSEALREAERLLLELAKEMRENGGDTDRAGELRDALDVPCRLLSEAETELLNHLSEDLYLLSGERRVVPLDMGESLEDLSNRLAITGWMAPERVLSLLRKVPVNSPTCPEDRLASMFGAAWAKLGFCEAGHAFCAWKPRAR